MHRYKIHFTRGGSALKDADRYDLDGALVCLYRGESLAAVIPRRIVTRIEEEIGCGENVEDPMLNWMGVLTKQPLEGLMHHSQ